MVRAGKGAGTEREVGNLVEREFEVLEEVEREEEVGEHVLKRCRHLYQGLR
jgi:hypothetical protein